MSEKYKDALNKIVVTDELKEKIIANASSQKIMPTAVTETKTKRLHYSRLRYGMNIAACFWICVCVLLTSKYVYGPGISPIDEVPSHVTPISETDKQDSNNMNDVVPQIKDNDSPNYNTDSVVPSNTDKVNTTPKKTPLNNALSSNNAETGSTPLNTDNNNTNIEDIGNGLNVNIDTSNESPIIDTDVLVQNPFVDNSVLAVNPIYSAENIEEIKKQVGYVFKLPQYLPNGYTLGDCGVLLGSLIEINYNSDDNSILYRTEKTNGNISGDYNEYERIETETVNNKEITLKGDDDLYYNVVWNDDSAYALNIANGMDKETIMKIVESVDYPNGEKAEAENRANAGVEAEAENRANAGVEAETENGANAGVEAATENIANAGIGVETELENRDKSDAETEISQSIDINEVK